MVDFRLCTDLLDVYAKLSQLAASEIDSVSETGALATGRTLDYVGPGRPVNLTEQQRVADTGIAGATEPIASVMYGC